MLELRTLPSDVVGCFARPEALDQLTEHSELSFRVAPDELLVVGTRHYIREIDARLSTIDPDRIVIDLSSAFETFRLCGDGRFEAFCRLSAVPLPATFGRAQGLVAHVPVKTIVREDDLLLIVSSALSHYLRERVLVACRDLASQEDVRIRSADPTVEPVVVG